MEGLDTYNRTTAYRFNIQDPIPFNKSLKVAIEHKGARIFPDGKVDGYLERADDFSSVAYWYQIEPHVEFTKMPPVEQRLYDSNGIEIEGESLLDTAKSEGGPVTTQELMGWSGGKQLFFTPQVGTGSFKVTFKAANEGQYTIRIYPTKSWDYGIYKPYLDGNPIGKTMDLYSPDVTMPKGIVMGTLKLTQGDNTLKFECKGKNPVSEGYYFGLDLIELVPVK